MGSTTSGFSAVPIVPNDATTFGTTRGLYVGSSGDVRVSMGDGTTVTFPTMAGGVVHPLCVNKVFSTGTTATNLVAVY